MLQTAIPNPIPNVQNQIHGIQLRIHQGFSTLILALYELRVKRILCWKISFVLHEKSRAFWIHILKGATVDASE